MREIIIGTRKSKLALIQTNKVIDALRKKGVKNPMRVKEIATKGDKNVHVSLAELGSGVFLEELEAKLVTGEIDFAVHSLKDIPLTLPEGLTLAAIPEREDHRDAYLANGHVSLEKLKPGAIIGTSSLRRAAQILAIRPDLETRSIRGPIDSRMEQLKNGRYDAIILAVAGIKRLGVGEELITTYLSDDTFVPAIGQGALAIECRRDNREIIKLVQLIEDEAARRAVTTERLFVNYFTEEEQAAVAAYAHIKQGQIHLHGMVISADGQIVLQDATRGKDPASVAGIVAEKLLKQGALEIISVNQNKMITD